MAADTFESAKDCEVLVQHLDTIYQHESNGNLPPPWFLSARSFDQLQKCLLAIELVSGCTASAAADGSPGCRAPPEQCDLPQPWMLALLWMLLQVSSV